MLFHSVDFWVFFAVVVTLHFLIPHAARWVLLLAASYFFYMSWNAAYLVLILVSTGVDYVVGLRMADTTAKKARQRLLAVSLTANLGLLFVFKYWGFFGSNVNALSGWLGFGEVVPRLDVILPVGISFYTFQTLSYTIDLYRGVIPAERHLGRFALYVAFFPQLVAGPIERARAFLPQIPVVKRFDYDRMCSGLQLMLWGLFKKVVIADRLALYVDAVYGNVAQHSAVTYLIATYAFAFQIYCDFSGYSDLAIGGARVLGFDLMKNFSRPFLSANVMEFWRRWHISLSTWLRDYLFYSLGRGGNWITVRNLTITMFLGGLWHGASWSFVLWGLLHGVLLAVSASTVATRDGIYRRLGIPGWLRRTVGIVLTFHVILVTWVFFRAESIGDVWTILGSFFGPWGELFIDAERTLLHASLGLSVLAVAHLVQERYGSGRALIQKQPLPIRWGIWYFLMFSIVLFGVDSGSQFIYFQF